MASEIDLDEETDSQWAHELSDVLAPMPPDLTSKTLFRNLGARMFERSAPRLRVGRFTVERVVGSGGFGTVFDGFDPVLQRRVALKVVRTDAPSELLSEARALARVSHPNVVGVFESGVEDGQVFIAMEFLAGGTLGDWLATPRSWTAVLETFGEIAAGVAAIHAEGLAHGDFSPRNVIFDHRGRPKLVDFGLSSVVPTAPVHVGEETARTAKDDRLAFFRVFSAALRTSFQEPPPRPIRRALDVLLRRGALESPRGFASMDDVAFELRKLSRTRSQRWWRRLGVATIVAAGIGWAIAPAPEEPCAEAQRTGLLSFWGPEHRARLASTFAASDAPQGTWQVFEKRMDRIGGQWTEAWAQACAAEGSLHSAPVGSGRLQCLARRRDTLAGLTAALLSGDPDLPGNTLDVTSSMGFDVGEDWGCQFASPAPHDASAPESGIHQAALVDAGLLLGREQYARAETAMRELLTELPEAGGLTAAAHRVLAEALVARGQVDEARVSGRRAFHLATAAGRDDIAARAAAVMVQVEGLHAGDLEAAESWMEHATASNHRRGVPDGQDYWLAQARMAVYIFHARHEPAQAAALACRDWAAAAGSAAGVALAEANLAILAYQQGDPDRAEKIATAVLAKPDLLGVALNVARMELLMGTIHYDRRQLDDADAAFARAQETFAAKDHPEWSLATRNRGNVAMLRNDLEAAEALFAAVLDASPVAVRDPADQASLAEVLRRRGAFDRAQALFDPLVAECREKPLASCSWIVGSRGQLALDQGRPEQAVTYLREALRLAEENPWGAAMSAEIRFQLARALWEGDNKEQALRLARQAAPDLAGEERLALDQWLADHPG